MAYFHKSNSDYDRHRFRCRSNNHHCCKRHPNHHQSPGVCSLCLTEKLARILNSSRKTSDSLSSSNSSSYYSSASSSSPSSCSSPNLYNSDDRRKTAFVFSAASIFKKSKSMAAIGPRLRGGTESDCGKKSSNLGFWWRFFNRPPRRKRMELEEVLMHSRTVVHRNVHG